MTESFVFLKAIEDCPGDLGPKLLYADHLDEEGFTHLALAYRWMAYRGKRPGRRCADREGTRRLIKPWAWWWDQFKSRDYRYPETSREWRPEPCHTLSPHLMASINSGYWVSCRWYYSEDRAVAALADALAHLTNLVRPNPLEA